MNLLPTLATSSAPRETSGADPFGSRGDPRAPSQVVLAETEGPSFRGGSRRNMLSN